MIGIVRILSVLPVLRWPLAGAVFAIMIDLSDLALMTAIHMGGVGDYQQFDKLADLPMMVAFMVVALRWETPAKQVAAGLFAVRIAGVIAFELTGARAVLFAFPNLFELWFLFVAALHVCCSDYELTRRRTAAWLLFLLVLKLGQEYLLHIWRPLDLYTLPEFIELVMAWLESAW